MDKLSKYNRSRQHFCRLLMIKIQMQKLLALVFISKASPKNEPTLF